MANMLPKNVIKKRHKNFPFWAPRIKISGYANVKSADGLLVFRSEVGLSEGKALN